MSKINRWKPTKGKTHLSRGLNLVLRNGPTYYVSGTYRRVRVRESTQTTDRDAALGVMRDIMARIDCQRAGTASSLHVVDGSGTTRIEQLRVLLATLDPLVFGGLLPGSFASTVRTRKRTIEEACNGYLEAVRPDSMTQRCVERLRSHFGPTMLCEEFTQDSLRSAFKNLGGENVRDATLKRQILSPIRSVLTWAATEWGPAQGCSRPAFRKMTDGERRDRVVAPHEAVKILDLARARGMSFLEPILVVAVCEGPRRADLHNLSWEHLDLTYGVMDFRNVKSCRAVTQHHRIDDLRPRTIRILKKWKTTSGLREGKVFRREDGREFPNIGSFGKQVNDALRVLSIAAELPRPDEITLHMLRHSAASWDYVQDPDIERVRIRMGWKSEKMAFRYVHMLPKRHRDEVLAFWEVDQTDTGKA